MNRSSESACESKRKEVPSFNILDQIVARKRVELEVEKRRLSPAELKEAVISNSTKDFRAALLARECAIIAEVKRKSPSKGALREITDPASVAIEYEKCGASAISVLTDKHFFEGDSSDLIRVRESTTLPILRKDFIIDPYQVFESKLLGADSLLLIASLLGPALGGFVKLSESLGLHPLVEIHSEDDLALAVEAGARMIGINNRNLKTFQTDIRKSMELMPLIPEGIVVVSESGIRSRQEIHALMDAGIHAFLIGEGLMRANDIGLKFRELLPS
ncbi:MAG: indole-3-glycerol phosphate synthase TrpC [Desulfobacteraceae bacterium]|nr:MAG: indole-3-glycerol phosphate synthase TrpC [Desulfobacteraceae bacterium]